MNQSIHQSITVTYSTQHLMDQSINLHIINLLPQFIYLHCSILVRITVVLDADLDQLCVKLEHIELSVQGLMHTFTQQSNQLHPGMILESFWKAEKPEKATAARGEVLNHHTHSNPRSRLIKAGNPELRRGLCLFICSVIKSFSCSVNQNVCFLLPVISVILTPMLR